MNTPLVIQTIDLAQNDELFTYSLSSRDVFTPSKIAALIDIDHPGGDGRYTGPNLAPAPPPRNGTLSQGLNGGPITYTPSAGFVGTDTFHYWACVAGEFLINDCTSASVTVTVTRASTTTTTRPPSTTTTTAMVFEPITTTTTATTEPPTTTPEYTTG